MMYYQINRSRVVHMDGVADKCHYYMRGGGLRPVKGYERKPRGCTVCDECQRQTKLQKRQKAK